MMGTDNSRSFNRRFKNITENHKWQSSYASTFHFRAEKNTALQAVDKLKFTVKVGTDTGWVFKKHLKN